jgi:uncharacterized protein
MSDKNSIFQDMQNDIENSILNEDIKKTLYESILKLKNEKVNLMITGATGCGKSSTINALFEEQVAKVGIGVDPETMDIKKFDLKNLILWDSPGLGDGKEKDNIHAKNIINKLNEKDANGNALIDLVLVIIDGSSRDLGTSYELINNVIIPNLGENPNERIIIAINQADMAMKGRGWNHELNKPESNLIQFLEDKIISIKKRIKEATAINVEPIFYAAGYKEISEDQIPYNLSKLLYLILKYTPKNKRLSYQDNISSNEKMWENNDELDDYNEKIKGGFIETIQDGIDYVGDIGEEIGEIFGTGKTGKTMGKILGGIGGAVVAVGKSLYEGAKSFFSGW